jgi:hypothetical protein
MAKANEIVNDALHNAGAKPLFIPLKTQWFREFESGAKDTEYRAYGPRWNERTCRVGRKATVSHGYSGKRLERVVAAFEVLSRADAPAAARTIYPEAAFIAAALGSKLTHLVSKTD